MSNLVLSRRAGDAILVGDKHLEVLQVDRAKAQLRIVGRDPKFIQLGGLLNIVEGVTVQVAGISRGSVRLSFEAPPAVKIIRTELLP